AANLAKAVAQVKAAAQQGAALVCLPELFRTQYIGQREDHALFDLAEAVPGPSTEKLGSVAREAGVVVIASVFERRAPGLYHNTAAVIDADGKVKGIYRKMHIPDDPAYYEKFYFTPGDLGFRAFDTKVGPIGTLVCWDQWYPDGARLTALQGANILLYPTAIGWPHNVTDWPGKFPPIPWVYAEIVRHVTPGETVRILVNSAGHRAQAMKVFTRAGIDRERLDFLRFPTNRGWTRDFGPIFVRKGDSLAIARFHFNAWAKYKDWKKDDLIPVRAAKQFKRPLIDGRIVLEGGSIDVNGRGTLITTEECLLDPRVQARNPGLSRYEIENVFRETLGITNTLWLGKGIAGDDTHGHVDDLCRFVNPTTVVP